jgi:glycosyltransferase involved in cell wall biosynthesis
MGLSDRGVRMRGGSGGSIGEEGRVQARVNHRSQPRVTLFFRRPWPVGSYSIEASFEAMLAAYPADAPLQPCRHVSGWFSQGLLPRVRAILEARRAATCVNHVTGDVHYLVFGLPRGRTVLTIHDCGFLHQRRGVRRALLQWLWLRLPVRFATVVTVVSEASRREVIALSGCAPGKVEVVPTSIDARFRPRPRGQAERPVVLHIGTTPNKNLERHVEALRGLPVRLCVVGALDDAQRALLARSGVEHEVRSRLSTEEMVEAYAAADLLLFASTFEGFGMPILEAQAVGRPVVTANLSSMPEVGGDAACYVDPFDPASIRAGVQRVLADADYRAALVERGLRNVERFAAATTARSYARIYARLAGARDG